MNTPLSIDTLYRLPWNLTDNAISWLEPTSACNLRCDGCYRENREGGHKTLEAIERELDVFARLRRSDSISVAGGEPLSHPEIAGIVRAIARRGWKPVINSNGVLLSAELLAELKREGLTGFTFHVDSGQNRPNYHGASESDLNTERLRLAEKLDMVGGISCNFNATVYPETLEQAPEILRWGREHVRIVHGLVFILYRMAVLGIGYDTWVGAERVAFDDMAYASMDPRRRTNVTSPELLELFRKTEPGFTPCAFLNGTEQADSYKWLLTERFANSRKVFGYAGPKFIELVQTGYHVARGRYLAYAAPRAQRRGRLAFLLAPVDRGVRRAMFSYFGSAFTRPSAFWKRVHLQSVMIIQPADLRPTGAVNMCDGCPDMTVWNDTLVWSCRLEEQFRWGENIRLAPSKNPVKPLL